MTRRLEEAKRSKPPDVPRKGASKKNTKKWCRGKDGVAHEFSWKTTPSTWEHRKDAWRDYSCDVCGRKENSCVGWFFSWKCVCGFHDKP